MPVKGAIKELIMLAVQNSQLSFPTHIPKKMGVNPSPLSVSASIPLCSELPTMTRSFYGRAAELTRMEELLDSRRSGQKGIVLHGIGGSGKTQLARRYVELHRHSYNAIIWVSAYSPELMNKAFIEIARMITSFWPQDLPNTYTGSNIGQRVASRLRSTIHTNWLYIIDSAENIDHEDYSRYVPNCPHGTIIVTTTRSQSTDVFGLPGLEIDRLQTEDACNLLIARSKLVRHPKELSEDGKHSSMDLRPN